MAREDAGRRSAGCRVQRPDVESTRRALVGRHPWEEGLVAGKEPWRSGGDDADLDDGEPDEVERRAPQIGSDTIWGPRTTLAMDFGGDAGRVGFVSRRRTASRSTDGSRSLRRESRLIARPGPAAGTNCRRGQESLGSEALGTGDPMPTGRGWTERRQRKRRGDSARRGTTEPRGRAPANGCGTSAGDLGFADCRTHPWEPSRCKNRSRDWHGRVENAEPWMQRQSARRRGFPSQVARRLRDDSRAAR